MVLREQLCFGKNSYLIEDIVNSICCQVKDAVMGVRQDTDERKDERTDGQTISSS